MSGRPVSLGDLGGRGRLAAEAAGVALSDKVDGGDEREGRWTRNLELGKGGLSVEEGGGVDAVRMRVAAMAFKGRGGDGGVTGEADEERGVGVDDEAESVEGGSTFHLLQSPKRLERSVGNLLPLLARIHLHRLLLLEILSRQVHRKEASSYVQPLPIDTCNLVDIVVERRERVERLILLLVHLELNLLPILLLLSMDLNLLHLQIHLNLLYRQRNLLGSSPLRLLRLRLG
ncbi:hypothetical protein BCR35DRAFT_305444 [Leucosporidium creatinivorum]|uniref:Uncharacterized protein n=1 Tax=Leucosporidium creatinivorum TaxID=106004 RepID=A0A1Y2F1D6_9BASI|nr:hypothetical protein BCR35DRAFT_305444 [Leucosporidium creatinivorum]